MYVSRAVESIRADPIAGESVSLVVETADSADPESVAAAAEDAGATVERELQFDDLQVAVDQADVDALCDLEGLDAIQTADAIGTHPDEAEEDVELGEVDGSGNVDAPDGVGGPEDADRSDGE